MTRLGDIEARLKIDFAKDLTEHGISAVTMGLMQRAALIDSLVETALHHCGGDDD